MLKPLPKAVKPVTESDLQYLIGRMVREEGATPEIAAQMIQTAQELKATNLYKVALSRYRSYVKRAGRNTPVEPDRAETPVIEQEPVIAQEPTPALQMITWQEIERPHAPTHLRVLLPEGGFMMVANPTKEQIAAWDAEWEAMRISRENKKVKEMRDTAAHAREVCARMAELARRRESAPEGEEAE